MRNGIEVPGKVLFYGGYSVLLKGHISLSIAVLDSNGKGISADYKIGEKRIISNQFNVDIEPSLPSDVLVAYPYVITELYLKSKGHWRNIEVKLTNSKIFGSPNEKSGLGSSAAAIVAIVKALFEGNGLDTYSHIETIHKLAQISYAMYAKKVGSGFDIATSSFGKTIVYYRYNPDEIIMPTSFDEEELTKVILKSVEKPWLWIKVEPINLEVGLAVFNVSGGKTSTISSVKAWKEWKKTDEKTFTQLMELQNEVENKAIHALINKDYKAVREYTIKAREVHRRMQNEIKKVKEDFDPIEPEPLRRIIEKAEAEVPGIIAGRCPGAGGWDSVAFLTKTGVDYQRIIDIGKEEGLILKPLDITVV